LETEQEPSVPEPVEDSKPSEDVLNKFNAIIDSFISSEEPKEPEQIQEEEVTVEEPISEVKQEETTVTSIKEPSELNSEAKDKFNSIIDEFINNVFE